jgi:hydrogenase maturation protease
VNPAAEPNVAAAPRRPCLVLALGNPLMGDDGVGWHLALRLRGDPRLPSDVEVVWGGTDLLGCGDLMAGRRRVVLVDALAGGTPGELVPLDPADPGLESAAAGAHALSAPAALALLRGCQPGFAATEVRFLGVEVAHVAPGEQLSPAVAARLAGLVEEVLEAVR